MAYGITSTSQIIDLNTIKAGCQAFKDALQDFQTCGETVIQAGETCNAKALSVDETSLQFSITQLGSEIKELKTTFASYADQVLAEATQVYNAQVAEYEEYIRKLNSTNSNNNNNNN